MSIENGLFVSNIFFVDKWIHIYTWKNHTLEHRTVTYDQKLIGWVVDTHMIRRGANAESGHNFAVSCGKPNLKCRKKERGISNMRIIKVEKICRSTNENGNIGRRPIH